MNLSAGDGAGDLERAIDFRGAVEDMGALADAVAERARAKAAALPHFLLKAHPADAVNRVNGDAGAHGGLLGCVNGHLGDFAQAGAQAVAELLDSLLDAGRPDGEVEIEGGLGAHQQGQAAGAALGQAVSIVIVIGPVAGSERGPDVLCEVGADPKEAVAGGRQQPLVEAGDVGVAADIAHIHRNVAEGLRSVDDGDDAAGAGGGADVLRRHDGAAAGDDVRKIEHARARGEGLKDEIDQFLRTVSGAWQGDFDNRAAMAFGGGEPGAFAAGMLLVAHQNLGAGRQIQSGGDVAVGAGDVFGERDLFPMRVDQAPSLGAELLHGVIAADPVGAAVVPVGDVGGHLAQMVDGSIEHHARHGADGSVIEEDLVAGQRKLVAQLVPVGRVGGVGKRWRAGIPGLGHTGEPGSGQRGGGDRLQELPAVGHGFLSVCRALRACQAGEAGASGFGNGAKQDFAHWSGFEPWERRRSCRPLSDGEPRWGITPWKAVGLSKSNGALPAVRAAPGSGIGRAAGTQAQPEEGKQVHGRANAMVAAVQIAQPVKTFDDQSQEDQQPNDQDAVGLVVADVLHAITVFAIVEAAILDLPAALGHAVETQAAQFGDGEVGQPFGLDHRAVALVLAVAQHAHGRPVQGFPRVEVIGVPNLDSVVPFLEHGPGWLAVPASTHGGCQQRKVLLEARHDWQSDLLGGVQERSGGVFTVSHHIVGKARSQMMCRAP